MRDEAEQPHNDVPTFSLRFTGSPHAHAGGLAQNGIVSIGDFEEGFTSSLRYWDRHQYEGHWKAAAERLLRGEPTSAFITSIEPPGDVDYVIWWPAWREGDKVLIQNQLLFFSDLSDPFDPKDPFKYVGPRDHHSEEGELISSWELPASGFFRQSLGR